MKSLHSPISPLLRRASSTFSPAILSQLPSELADSLATAHALNPTFNAFTSILSPTEVLKAYQSSPKGGRLHGWSVGVKDVFCTTESGLRTTAASRMLENYESPFEATVVTKLRNAGGVVLGKTNMDEFGMGSANLNSHFGAALNPAGALASSGIVSNQKRVAGGSSGGSAAAVAAGMCRIALASDTGGSTRLPASYCGVLGLKPSYGLLSRWGMIAYASSLDCVGLVGREVGDIAAAFDVMEGYDEKDPTSASEKSRDVANSLHGQAASSVETSSPTNLTGLKIGIPSEYFPSELSPSVLPAFRNLVSLLQSLGAAVVPVSLPSTTRALGAYYIIASAEAGSNLARFDGVRFGTRSSTDLPQSGEEERLRPLYAETRSQGFGKEVQKRLLLGAHALSADAFNNYYLQAQTVRQTIRDEFNRVFSTPSPLTTTITTAPTPSASKVDFLLHPTSISIAPLLNPPSSASSTSEQDRSSYIQDILSVPASLAGLPAISVPMGRVDGWPVGAQLVGQWGGDRRLLELVKVLEEAGVGK
ncbi:aspartyl-tRNA(Asn)/glutamyl-tRNA (Gln) amidotransferase subunit A [Pseudohyphozyma bogoriensis]|nr:aspartyl-tRNA(Asn)/glutamyl-tRNA (Gln) amidotransferase subunit A [Pseudohyphozyma bogoriensis]